MAAHALARPPAALLRRKLVEEHIQALVDLLDALDDDPDIEPEEMDQDAGEENEIDCDREEGDGGADDEPSLGSRDDVGGGHEGVTLGSQAMWGVGNTEDLEDDPAEKHACADGDAVLEQYGIAHYSGARGIEPRRASDHASFRRGRT